MFSKSFRVFHVLLSFLVIFSYLLPLLKVGSSTFFKPDYLILLIIDLIIIFSWNQVSNIKLIRRFYLLFILIFIGTLISNYISGFYYLKGSNFRIPLTVILIFNKISSFTYFAILIYKGIISYKTIIRITSLVFILAGLFGAFQFLDLFGAKDLALKYYIDESGVQGQVFLMANRITGVSAAVISWGGCSLLMFYFFYYLEKNTALKITGIILSVLNIVGTASRASLFAFIASFVLIMIFKVVFVDKKLISLFKATSILIIMLIGGWVVLKTYLPEQVEFLEMRIGQTEDAMTVSGRGEQLDYFSNLLGEDPFGYVFGVGDSVIVEYGYLEVDYAYIFVAFGIVGFVLHYLLLYFLIKEVSKFKSLASDLYLFTIASTLGYLIFSIGFFFFYEIYMGLPYWWLNGIVVGMLWKLKKEQSLLRERDLI